MEEPSEPASFQQELLEPWKAVLKSLNYLAVFVVFAAFHYCVDEYIVPIVIPDPDSLVRTSLKTVFNIAFGLVYIRQATHMVQVFYPGLSITINK